MKARKYIRQHYADITRSVKGTNIYPSVMLALAVMESADEHGVAGNSVLSKQYNNHFNLIASPSTSTCGIDLSSGKLIYHYENQDKLLYNRFDRPIDCFKAKANELQNTKAYHDEGVFTAESSYPQLKALQRSGYSLSDDFVEKSWHIISHYQLIALDRKAPKRSIWNPLTISTLKSHGNIDNYIERIVDMLR